MVLHLPSPAGRGGRCSSSVPHHMARWPHHGPRRFAKGCEQPGAARCRARAGSAMAHPFPCGSLGEQHQQLQHPPAPGLTRNRGTSRTPPWATAATERAASLPVLSRRGMNPDQPLPPVCSKSSCFPVKTLTVAVWQRLLLLLTKQSWDFSREAAAAQCVKLLHQPERGLEINICIFALLLQL